MSSKDRPTSPGSPARDREKMEITPEEVGEADLGAMLGLPKKEEQPTPKPELEEAPKPVAAVAIGGPPPALEHADVGAGAVTARAFADGKGLIKEGRAAGFLHHAAELGPPDRRSVAEWEKILAESWARPVK